MYLVDDTKYLKYFAKFHIDSLQIKDNVFQWITILKASTITHIYEDSNHQSAGVCYNITTNDQPDSYIDRWQYS